MVCSLDALGRAGGCNACAKMRRTMGKTFDIGLEALAAARSAQAELALGLNHGSSGRGTFFLETFGCQMNEHDSEKVAGVLLARGYQQVETPDAASVILYNTCSIREKAAQKVFSRLGEYRPADWTGKNRRFGEQTIGAESPGQKDSATTAEPAPSDRSNDRRLETESGETG